jgi:hypothetical protein
MPQRNKYRYFQQGSKGLDSMHLPYQRKYLTADIATSDEFYTPQTQVNTKVQQTHWLIIAAEQRWRL